MKTRSLVRPFALAVCLASALGAATGCDLLKKLKKDDADADSGAAATASAEPSATASASAAPADTASAAAVPSADVPLAELKLPGSCIDPKADATKRSPNGSVTLDDSMDLDGDNKKDRLYTTSMQNHQFGFLYIMRGTCGHFVGETGSNDGWKVSNLRSSGLRSFELTYADACTADCGCVTRSAPFFFNGTKYVTGKTKEVVAKPCDAGAPKDAGPAAPVVYKVGDKINVEWKGGTYPATIFAVLGPDKYKIHYDGYEAKWDEVVGAARIKGRR